MDKNIENLAELVDETVKKVALGLYINLNYSSYASYQKPFKVLVLENPLSAFNLIKKVSSINTARLLFRIIMRALNFDSVEIENILNSLEKGDERSYKDALIRRTLHS